MSPGMDAGAGKPGPGGSNRLASSAEDFSRPFQRAPEDTRAAFVVIGLAVGITAAVVVAVWALDASDFRGDPTALGVIAGIVALAAAVWVARSFAVDRDERSVERRPEHRLPVPRVAPPPPDPGAEDRRRLRS